MKKDIKRFENIIESAFEAEKEIDLKDNEIDYPTFQKQKSHIIIRLSRIASGFLIIFVGLLGFVLPVIPGAALLLLGLGILSIDFKWAHAFRIKLQVKLAGNKEGKISKKRTIIFTSIGIVAFCASLTYSYFKYIRK